MYTESDPRILEVLSKALKSTSRTVRVRAVSMLARVDCASRGAWLAEAANDSDEGVRDAALAVTAWILVPTGPRPWPDREELALDRVAGPLEPESELEVRAALGWEWEYAIEVWREDGLLIGVFLSATCSEDDEHAKKIALGQAILSSAEGRGDSFDPAMAAAFIVGKRRVRRSRPSRRTADQAWPDDARH